MEKVIHSAVYIVGDFRITMSEMYNEDTRKSRWEVEVVDLRVEQMHHMESFDDVSVANEYLLSALDYFKTL